MKNNRDSRKGIVQPDLGPRNWVAGKSLNDSGTIGFPGEKLSSYLQKLTDNNSKGKEDNNLFPKG
ncbi:hypothetical protein U0035_22265 [Niabella yanshanensis]|uniref:Transposase n=1 Tax=Niabella yanshanensis TaxID=577386 RepID=A0ABZ0WA41_9BACT|nr:hypothetical protein [Niabella yanshanensis]WQD38402.1 hypothetical protein U0035_22265 [Niabella yanshanensis]